MQASGSHDQSQVSTSGPHDNVQDQQVACTTSQPSASNVPIFQPTLDIQTKIIVIQHNTSSVTTFHKYHSDYIHQSSNKILQTKFECAEAT